MKDVTQSRRTSERGHHVATLYTRRVLLVPTARKQELLVPLLAFCKCHAIHPEAFQPVEYKQRCKAETLMKCINLEHRASVLITVWFVYEPSQKQNTRRRRRRRRRGGGGWGGITEGKTVQYSPADWPIHSFIHLIHLWVFSGM